ncbi:MAG: hypothetical protein R2822_31550 [Spirosomataceae bacterium]
MKELEIAHIYNYPTVYTPYYHLIRSVDSIVQSTLKATVSLQSDHQRLLITAPHVPTWGINDGVYTFLRSSEQLYIFRMSQQLYTGRNVLKRYANSVSIELPLNIFTP